MSFRATLKRLVLFCSLSLASANLGSLPARTHGKLRLTGQNLHATKPAAKGLALANKIRGGALVDLNSPAVPILGVVLANAMMFSSIPAVVMARRKGSLEGINPVPLAMVLANCIAWTVYGLNIGDIFIFLANAPGVLVGLFLFSTGIQLGTPKQRKLLEGIVLGAGTLFLSAGAKMGLTLRGQEIECAAIAAAVANVITIMFYLSPLSAVKQVIETRSARALVLPLAATSFMNSALWMSCKFPRLSILYFRAPFR